MTFLPRLLCCDALKRYGLFCVLTLSVCLLPALSDAQQKPARILFLLDASGSMAQSWQNQESRFNTASRIMLAIMDSVYAVNDEVSFAVRVFGAQYPASEKNCYDSRLEVPFAYQNASQIKARLHYLQPRGYSPIAWSLQQAAEKDFVQDDQYAYSLILITDGGESCGGDICATVENLLAKKISFKPYILSLINYTPLKDQYACLGQFLTVSQESEIMPAIKRIINDNRKILSVKATGLKAVPKHNIPSVSHQKAAPVTVPVHKTVPSSSPPKEAAPEQDISRQEPVRPEWKRPVAVNAQRIAGSPPIKLNLLYALPVAERHALTHLPPIRLKEAAGTLSKPVVHSSPVPARTSTTVNKNTAVNKNRVAAPGAPKKITFDIQTEDAQETTLEIYFTDGKGTFYSTEPLMKFIDSKTQQEIKSIYRNVSAGAPVPIKIPAGTYDIYIPGSDAKATRVGILAGKTNKVYIKAGRASLAFQYPTAPGRPVKEYRALVSKRFEAGPVVKQQCSEALPYDPANYHVEINTLPPLIYNLDLSFDETKIVAIPEPGTIQILNQNNMGRVQFWRELGDEYVPFLEMDIRGTLSLQKADFLPGLYQVRYFRQPRKPYQKVEIVSFRITSNQTTDITLEN